MRRVLISVCIVLVSMSVSAKEPQELDVGTFMIGKWRVVYESQNHYLEVTEDDFLIPSDIEVTEITGGRETVHDYLPNGVLAINGRSHSWRTVADEQFAMEIEIDEGIVAFFSVNVLNTDRVVLIASMLYDHKDGAVLLVYVLERIKGGDSGMAQAGRE